MAKFSLTAEQEAIRQHFTDYKSIAIQALAGTGKTSTLVALAESMPNRRGMYLAFNDSIASDAFQKFPSSVTCNTTHVQAVSYLKRKGYAHERLVTTPNFHHLLRFAPQDNYEIPFGRYPLQSRQISRKRFCRILLSTLLKFSSSSSSALSWEHVTGIGGNSGAQDDKREFFQRYKDILESIRAEIRDPAGTLPIGHDLYLKLWTLDKPALEADFIMLDEAQDTNDPVIDLLRAQSAQIIYVGDSHQQIYDWRGAVDALKKISCECNAPLTGSFRFGEQIASVANYILGGLKGIFTIRGLGFAGGRVLTNHDQPPEAVLFRSNREMLNSLTRYLQEGVPVGVVGGVLEWIKFNHAIDQLEAGIMPDHPDFFGFKTIEEYREYCQNDTNLAGAGGQFFALREKIGPAAMSRLLQETNAIKNPTVVLSTVHKAKGLEWNSVRLHDDLIGDDDMPDSFRRLQYVAVTRAKQMLIAPPLFLNGIRF